MRYLMMFLLLTSSFFLRAQCFGPTLTTQDQVDAFVANWAGNCTTVNGSMHIGGMDLYNLSDIHDLSGLSFLTGIADGLQIEYCPNLTSLTGLENIVGIGGELWLIGLTQLTDLAGLNGLQSVLTNPNPLTQVVIIEYCDALQNLQGLEGLSEINGSLYVSYNDELESLEGLQNVTSINGALEINGNSKLVEITALSSLEGTLDNLEVRGNDTLQHIDGLNGITEIMGECLITVNTWLYHLNGLSGLTSVGDDLEIRGSSIVNMSGLQNLTYVGRDLDIQDNYNMVSLDGLNQLTTVVRNLDISENYPVSSVAGLQNLTGVGGNVLIYQAQGLQNCDGLQSLQSVGGYLEISANESMTSLSGLENVESVGTNITIGYNPLLTECAIASVCSHIQSGGEIYVYNNGVGCNDVTEVTNACDPSSCQTFAVTPMAQHTTCGLENGIAWVTVAGATAPITYAWENGATTAGIGDLAPGQYTVTVTDAEECSEVLTITVNGSERPVINAIWTNATCAGACDGTANAMDIMNGNAPYTYSWSNGSTLGTLADLCPGNYSVTVTDADGCTGIATIEVGEPPQIVITVDGIGDISEGDLGWIDITVSGGTGPYSFIWTGPGGFASEEEDVTGITVPGCYAVMVTDTNGCLVEMDSICLDYTTAIDGPPAPRYRIYPNPARDHLYIDILNGPASYTSRLYTTTGKLLKKEINTQCMDLSSYSSGIYLLKAEMADGTQFVTRCVLMRD